MEFIAATNNNGKLCEMQRILTRMGHTVISQREAGVTLEPEENGTTFAENALIKAREIAKITKKPTIADDSGLCVDALNGQPGVYSARYCGHHGDDDANNKKLLEQMQEVEKDNRKAQFVSCVCVYLPQDNRSMTATGVCSGQIAFDEKGTNGFGYDPLFIPDYVGIGLVEKELNTENRTYAQLNADEKDAISHRGMAMVNLEEMLPQFLSQQTV